MTPLVSLLIQVLPGLVAQVKADFQTQHPDDPEPTDAEVIAAFDLAYASSIAKDDAWLAAHPEVGEI